MRRRTAVCNIGLFVVSGALVGIVPPADARAQTEPEPGAPLDIVLVTFGPGDHPFYKFGHNAILVRDRVARTEHVYNFGTFDYESPTLVRDFIKGRFTYWLSVSPLPNTLYAYRRENRTIETQELDLDPAQKLALARRLEENALPANRGYLYDYYRDNCSTRVRDALDAVLGGAFREAGRRPGAQTYRDHTLRLTADNPVYFALLVVLGPYVDRPVTLWDEMFLPEKVRDTARTIWVGPAGNERPLVKREQTLFAATRPPSLAAPPSRVPVTLLVGACLGALLFALGRASRRGWRTARVGLGTLTSVFGLTLGFLGAFFLYAWLLTDHVSAHRNENILACAPFALLLAPLGIGVALGRDRVTRVAFIIARAAAVLAALGLALQILPAFSQDNGLVLAFTLPLWTGLALALAAPGSDQRRKNG